MIIDTKLQRQNMHHQRIQVNQVISNLLLTIITYIHQPIASVNNANINP